MSLKGLRFAGLEWKNITASRMMLVAIAAIAIMPLLYGALYLAAFQDPYSHLNSLPVAVVNEDRGATISDERRNLGDDVVDELEGTTDGLQWHFVSADEAQKGLEDGAYLMTCTILSDFSESVASVDGDNPEKAQIEIEYNQSENMLASQIGETVWKEVRTRVSDAIATEYWATMLGRVADSGKDIQTAAGGAGDLADGLTDAQDGSQQITTNLGTLKDGALALDGGLGTLAGGTSSLKEGLATLGSGTVALSQGIQALDAGASKANAGAQRLAQGSDDLKAGSSQVAGGLAALDAQSASLVDGSRQVSEGLGRLQDGSNAFASTVSGSLATIAGQFGGDPANAVPSLQASYEAALTAYATAVAKQGPGSPEAEAALATLNGALASLAAASQYAGSYGALAQVQAGYAAVGEGVDRLADSYAGVDEGIISYTDVVALLAGGAADLDAGVAKAQAGTKELADGTSQLAAGAASAQDGASQVASGAASASDGASQLDDGARSAKDGSARLADGASQLEGGSAALASGLADAVDGSGELAAALADGAKTADEQTTNIARKSEVMSDPVELVSEYYTKVSNYGTGFAPYLMALGLWVGGLVAGFVFKPLNNRLVVSGANPVTVAFANYLPVAFFSLIQATLLMAVLQFGLQLQIDNVPAFYAMGYLTSLVFAAIMQMLMATFGYPGKFLAVILLMLQLTASGGTFPIQTTPGFFQAVNPFMPMTYVIQAMRQVMTGLDYDTVAFDCAVLLAIGAACFALTCLAAWRRRTVRMEDLHPVLQLG